MATSKESKKEREAKKRIFQLIERNWKRNKDIDPIEIERVIDEAGRAAKGELGRKKD